MRKHSIWWYYRQWWTVLGGKPELARHCYLYVMCDRLILSSDILLGIACNFKSEDLRAWYSEGPVFFRHQLLDCMDLLAFKTFEGENL